MRGTARTPSSSSPSATRRASKAPSGAVARRQKLEVDDVAIDSSVSLIPTEERGFKLAVELAVTLPSVSDSEQAVALVQAAHGVCPYSNATRGNIDVRLTANGTEVEHG